MTPDERQMIADLFASLRNMGGQDKDREAEAFINQMIRQTPDSMYLLAQYALVRDMELQQAGDRINELEQQFASQHAPAQRGGGSFLGGAAAGAGAGAIGSRASQTAYGSGAPAQPVQPWGQTSGGFAGRAAGAPQPASAPMPFGAAQVPPPAAQAQAPARSGGFLKGALAAAAGVAGGVMLANSLGGLFGGSSAQASSGGGSDSWGSGDKASEGYKDDGGSNDQGDSWSDGGDGGDIEI